MLKCDCSVLVCTSVCEDVLEVQPGRFYWCSVWIQLASPENA